MSHFGQTCAVVVTYNIGAEYQKNFSSLIHQVDHIIVVDNDSCKETKQLLHEIQDANSKKVEVIYNDKNYGLGFAQNQGIRKALDQYQWVLLLDHDSSLDENMILRMKEYYINLSEEEQNKIALIAPNIFDTNVREFNKYVIPFGGFLFKRVKCNKQALFVYSVIASGSLIKTSVFRKIGFMREDYFIDSIDTEFCLRIRKHNMNIVLLKDSVLFHKLGNRVRYKIYRLNITPTNHSPQRRYFIYRNRVKVWKEYWKDATGYVLFEIIATAYDFLRILFLEKAKIFKIQSVLRGIKDGIL